MSAERWFHGSTHRLPVGTVLEPGKAAANFSISPIHAVCITRNPDDAAGWARSAHWVQETTGPVYVYEVQPIGEVRTHQSVLVDDVRCDQAVIIAVHSSDDVGPSHIEDDPIPEPAQPADGAP